MDLSDKDLDELATLAAVAAREAADHIRSKAGERLSVSAKEGGSSHASQVVTEVDLESQRLILDRLAASIREFELGLLTEESQDDASRFARDHFWCIDPLDGTLPFIENVAGYSVSIALVRRDGIPLVGAIADPLTGKLYHAVRGGGAFCDGGRLAIGPAEGGALTLVMDRSFAKQPGYAQLLEGVRGIAASQGLDGVRTINQGGAAMNACWVVENAPAIYFKLPKAEDGGGSLWDYAASACLFAELGAVATDCLGEPLQLNREGSTFMNQDGVVYASSAELGVAVWALARRS